VAAERGAWICLQDEAGHTLRPPKARTWGQRGRTPVIAVSGSGRISVAGLVGVKPGQRTRLLYRVKFHRVRRGERRSFGETDYAALLDAAHQSSCLPTPPTSTRPKASGHMQYRPDLLTSFLTHTGLTLDPRTAVTLTNQRL